MNATKLASIGMVVLATLLISPAAVSAQSMSTALSVEERTAGLWYADRMKFDQIREQGLTGKGITIAVVDTAINLDAPELQGADIEVMGQYCRDPKTGTELPAVSDDIERRHGTDVVSMLVGNGVAGDAGPGTRGIVPEAKILFYAADSDAVDEKGVGVCEAYNPETGVFEKDREVEFGDPGALAIRLGPAFAVSKAIADGADIVSVSSVHGMWDAEPWLVAQIHAMRAGVPFVAGTENPIASGTVEYTLPYSVNGVVAVGGVDVDANIIRGVNIFGSGPADAPGSSNLAFVAPGDQMLVPSSNEGWGPALGNGTSLATPLIAGTIALGLEKYPAATPFQVLQAMTRTTGPDGQAEPFWDGPKYGYGIAKPTAMLEVDPTQFPDENPFFIYYSDDPRCAGSSYEECKWSLMLPVPSDIWYEEEPADNPWTTGGNAGAIAIFALLGVGVLGVLAVAIIVPIVVVRSRRRRTSELESSDSVGREGNS